MRRREVSWPSTNCLSCRSPSWVSPSYFRAHKGQSARTLAAMDSQSTELETEVRCLYLAHWVTISGAPYIQPIRRPGRPAIFDRLDTDITRWRSIAMDLDRSS